MTELHRTDVDSVITLWVDAPMPLRAGLLFRTGRIDETLVTAGETHLIEHIVLSTLGDTTHPHNGFVGGAVAGFFTMGRPEEVSDFFKHVCDSLTSLPANRLETEKKVLAAEKAARTYNAQSNILTWRYGACGYGLLGMPELGLQRATLEQLQALCAQRFTAENAILWLSGPVPAGLRLNLPHGMKQAIPALRPIPQVLPSWYVDDACGGIVAAATVPRVAASSVFCAAVSRRLQNRLRRAQAVSYAPSVSYEPLNDNTAHLVLYADSEQAHRAELASEFGEVFENLGEFDDSEIDAAREQIRESWTGSHAPPTTERIVMDAQRAAMDWILGQKFEPLEVLEANLLSVTRDDVQEFGRNVHATAMFALPSEAIIRPCFGKSALMPLLPAVQGSETVCVDAPIRRERLVYGPQGVSLLWPDGSYITVRYSELAAVLTYKDGCVHLVGSDATFLPVEPTLWRDGQNICREIRKRVPADLILDQGSRSADVIPRPQTTAWQRLRAQFTRR